MMIIKGRLDFWSALLMCLSFLSFPVVLACFLFFVFVFNAASYFPSSQFFLSYPLVPHCKSLIVSCSSHTSPFFYTPVAILAGLLPKSMLKVWELVSVSPVFGRKRQRIMSSRPSWASGDPVGERRSEWLIWKWIPVPIRRGGLKEVPELASVGSWGSHLLGTSEGRV